MESAQLTSPELCRVIDQAGAAFEWTRSYQAVLGTSVGAAFAANGLDEAADTIGVTPPEVQATSDAIVEFTKATGRASRTATSYASGWRRLAEVAYRWKLAGGDEAPVDFWDTVEGLRDKRTRRRTPRKKSWELSGPAGPLGPAPGMTVVVELSTGTATVALPENLTEADLLKIVQAVLNSQ